MDNKILTKVREVILPLLLLFVVIIIIIDHIVPWFLQSHNHPFPYLQLSLNLMTGIIGVFSIYASYELFHQKNKQNNWKVPDDGPFDIIWRLYTFCLLVALSETILIIQFNNSAKDFGFCWSLIYGMLFFNLLLHLFCAMCVIKRYHSQEDDASPCHIPNKIEELDSNGILFSSVMYLYGRLPLVVFKISFGFLLFSIFPFPPVDYFKFRITDTNPWEHFWYWFIFIIGTYSIITSFIRLFKPQHQRIEWFSKQKKRKLWYCFFSAQSLAFLIGLICLIPGIADIPQPQMEYNGINIWKSDIVTGYVILAISFLSNIYVNYRYLFQQRLFVSCRRDENERTT